MLDDFIKNNTNINNMWKEYKDLLKDALSNTCKELGVELKQTKLEIHDVKFEGMKISCNINGKEYHALCDPEDIFDKEKGLLLCIAKAVGIGYRDIEKLIEKSKRIPTRKVAALCKPKTIIHHWLRNQLALVVDKVPDVAYQYLHTCTPIDVNNTYKVIGTGFIDERSALIIRAVDNSFNNWYNVDANIYVVYEDDVIWL